MGSVTRRARFALAIVVALTFAAGAAATPRTVRASGTNRCGGYSTLANAGGGAGTVHLHMTTPLAFYSENMSISWYDYTAGNGGGINVHRTNVGGTLDFYFTFLMGRPAHADLVTVTTNTLAAYHLWPWDHFICNIYGQDTKTIT